MNPEPSILAAEEHAELQQTVLVRDRLQEQFHDLEQQQEAASVGMWVFLATEVMFFGTMFVVLSVYQYRYADSFEKASEQLNWLLGGINMFVLVSSSLMMALAVHYAQLGRRDRLVFFLGLTVLLGTAFLVLKGFEYYRDIEENLVPGSSFDRIAWIKRGANPDHVQLFFLFYWIMTGTHALHVTIGIGVVTTIAILAWRGHYSRAYYTPVDVTGLYWHFVDIVWVFLYPTLYLTCTHTGKDWHF